MLSTSYFIFNNHYGAFSTARHGKWAMAAASCQIRCGNGSVLLPRMRQQAECTDGDDCNFPHLDSYLVELVRPVRRLAARHRRATVWGRAGTLTGCASPLIQGDGLGWAASIFLQQANSHAYLK